MTFSHRFAPTRAREQRASRSLTSADEPVVFGPVQLKAVETDHVLQVHQHHHQRVELVSQPEVCKANAVKRSRHHSKLRRKTSQEEPSSE